MNAIHGSVTPTDQGVVYCSIPPKLLRKKLRSLSIRLLENGVNADDYEEVSKVVRVLFEDSI